MASETTKLDEPNRAEHSDSAARQGSAARDIAAARAGDSAGEAGVTRRISEGVLVLRLNRPTASNAIDLPLAEQLRAAFDDPALSDPAARVRAVLIEAAGKNFCAGGDVSSFAAAEDPKDFLGQLAETFHAGLERIEACPVPVVAAVHGGVGGAGIGLVASSDVVICGSSAQFRPAYLSIGLSPDGGLSWMLPRYFGKAKAMDLLLNDGRFTAAEAASVGLVSRVVADDDVAGQAWEVAAALATGPGNAMARTRALVRDGAARSLAEHRRAEAAGIAASADDLEGREGTRAFAERRKPDFAGLVRRSKDSHNQDSQTQESPTQKSPIREQS